MEQERVLRVGRGRARWGLAAVVMAAALVMAACSGAPSTSAGTEPLGELASLSAPLAGSTMFGAVTPPGSADPDTKPTVLATRFTVDVDGTVSAIRFYKHRVTAGPFTGSLWTASGQRLATVNFTTTTRSGWQQAALSSPVRLSAGGIYVVSYFAPSGRYASTVGGLSSARSTGGPVRALADGDRGANGLYSYGGRSAFPSDTYRSELYYVDVVFTAGGRAAPAASATSTSTTTTSTTTSLAPAPATSSTTTTTAPAPRLAGWPGPLTTGVPAGTVLRPSGTIVVTQPGTVIDSVAVSGCIEVEADNVTIRRTKVTKTGDCLFAVKSWGANVKIEDTEIDGGGYSGFCIAYFGYTVTRVNMYGCTTGVLLGKNTTVQDSYIHSLTCLLSRGDHCDGVQTFGDSSGDLVTNVVIRRNNIDISNHGAPITASILLQAKFGPVDGIIIDGNRLNGGSYAFYGGYADDGFGVARNITFTNNTFGTGYDFGTHLYTGPSITWSNNILESTGAAVTM